MRPLVIDFAPQSFRRTVFLTSLTSWVGLVMALALCTAIALYAIRLTQQKNAIAAALSGLQQQQQAQLKRLAGRAAATKPAAIPEAKLSAVNKAIAQLNLPWTDVLNAIEAATPPQIALLTIEPDAKKQSIKLIAEANSSHAMVAYIEVLKKQPFFTSALLAGHEINEKDQNRPLRFQLHLQFDSQWRHADR